MFNERVLTKAVWVNMDKTERTENERCAVRMRMKTYCARPRLEARKDACSRPLRRGASPLNLRWTGIIWDATPTPLLWESWGASLIKAHPLTACRAFPGSEIMVAELTELRRPSTPFMERPWITCCIMVLASGELTSLAAVRKGLPLIYPSQLGEIKPQVILAIRGLEV